MTDITLDEFYLNLKEQINLDSSIQSSPKEEQFLNWALDYLVELGDIGTYDLVDDARDSNERFRADAFVEEDLNELSTGMLGIVISLFDQSDVPETLTKTELEKYLRKLQTFVSNAINKDIDNLYEIDGGAHILSKKIINQIKSNHPKIRFYVISNKPLSSRISDLDQLNFEGLKIETHIWDLNRFYQLEMQGKERVDTDVDLSNSPIKVLNASKESNELQIYLGVIPGKTLYEIFDKWGARLLEQNVRSFLGATNAANKGMRETIRNNPEKFIAFNNGLSATAENATFNDKGEIISLKNFQIVNGGQTSATIYAAGKNQISLENILVQMKLVVIKNDEEESDLIMKISEYSNTQSKVQKSDFFSHHDFHRRMNEMSTRIIAPPKPNSVVQTKWYYERLKKQYLNEQTHLSSSEKNKFLKEYPKNQLISKTDLGKFIMTFESRPTDVAKGGEYNLSRFKKYILDIWENNEANINDNFFRETIAKAIIWKKLTKNFLDQKKTSPSKIATFSIATLMNKVRNEKKFINYEKIWAKQDCPDNLFNLLDNIGQEIYIYATKDDRPVDNIDSYFKSEKLWDLVKQKVVDIDLSLISDLFIDRSNLIESKKESRKVQKLTNQLEIEIQIKLLTKEEWDKVRQYLIDNNEDTPTNIELIEYAIKFKDKLTPAQCKKIYDSFYFDFLKFRA